MYFLEDSTDPVDPDFVVDFTPYDDPDDATQRWTTWWSVEPLCRGPEPRPAWVVTDRGAVDTELGVLKTGKEADVHLLERAVRDGPAVVMAAKRYRDTGHRDFHRNAAYTEGRRGKDGREARAAAKGSAFGRAVAAGQWAGAEWTTLVRCWEAGLPVPYPVQLDGTEILMEWVSHDGETAPRLAQSRPAPDPLRDLFEQLREALATMTQHGLVHGDLSAYNLLVAGDRLVVIDLPQTVDLVANPQGFDFLLRDCANVCRWFRSKGLEVDEHELYADLLATAF
ncbi:serine protein kinase RIO [Nocardioides aequoreus]|uniref:serine protein kinase RIO n=1 Tax=Nocardioides aequoreus TaxID=397278 RepID=UPI0004C4239D|nr:RIO1 family regulatory kinase/ATPase [Nocardioides aequoreus]